MATPRALPAMYLLLMTFAVEEGRLRRHLAEVRNRVAERHTVCAEPKPVTSSPDIDTRSRRENAQVGEIELWLVWDGTTDLDLIVKCPSGDNIYHKNKDGCGGRLDIDMNCRNCQSKSEHPVEHIFWQADHAPPGKYQVLVSNYHDGPPTPFVVRLKKSTAITDFPEGVAKTQAPILVG